MDFDLNIFMQNVLQYKKYLINNKVQGKTNDFLESELELVKDLLENIQVDIWIKELTSDINIL